MYRLAFLVTSGRHDEQAVDVLAAPARRFTAYREARPLKSARFRSIRRFGESQDLPELEFEQITFAVTSGNRFINRTVPGMNFQIPRMGYGLRASEIGRKVPARARPCNPTV